MRSRAEFGVALLLQLLGSALVLLIATRHWQTAHVLRPHPLTDQSFALSGRTLDSASTALAVVALAGVVAILAVRAWPRRVIGGVIAVVGAAIVWRSLGHDSAVSLARAYELHGDDRNVNLGGALPGSHVSSAPAWAWLSAVGGLVVVASGLMTAARGHRWAGLSARYEAPVVTAADAQAERARADASLWKALDEGDDPTARN